MDWRERERAFYIGAPLAIIPALGFLPAVMFLLVVPGFPHARAIAVAVLPVLALLSSCGLWKLALGAVQKPFGILNAVSVGALLVLLIIAAYTGLFLAILAAKF
ncbi:MAG TPA: hypothetical protein VLT90_15180 [Terriglobales bacterium]|nr:hypothetical protein [Terriglobales bacterium]